MAQDFNMDDFTPPPPSQLPPPLPPPPRDYSPNAFYRSSSVTSRSTDAPSSTAVATSISVGETDDGNPRPRRPSFSFLSRTKSHNVPTTRSPSGQTMLRKQKLRDQEERLRQQHAASVATPPPRLPSHSPLPTINTFGGEEARPDSVAIISNKAGNFSRPSVRMSSVTSGSSPGPHGVPIPQFHGSTSPAALAARTGDHVDLQARTESITNRGRYSYASGAVGNVNSPRRVRRRKDPTPFNILVIGAKNSGKTSFIELLRNSLALPASKRATGSPPPHMTSQHDSSAFTSCYLDTEIEGERIGLTLWDSQGLEKHIIDLQLREMISFIESKFEETFMEEQKVMRTPGVKDTHIHCVFLVLDPVRLDATVAISRAKRQQSHGIAFATSRPAGLDEDLDLQVMRALAGKTTVVPVISKADTLTNAHMTFLKRSVWSSVQAAKLDPLEALGLDEDEEGDEDPGSDEHESSSDVELPIQKNTKAALVGEDKDEEEGNDDSDIIDNLIDRSDSSSSARTASSVTTPSPARQKQAAGSGHARSFSQLSRFSNTGSSSEDVYIPFSLLSPDPYDPSVPGRQFPWGLADPYNPLHCDFVRLRDSVFNEWRAELRLAAREKWYEGWRTSRLKRTPQRIRQAGGVTPVAVVPREGRSSSGAGHELTPIATPTHRAVSAGKAEKVLVNRDDAKKKRKPG